MENDKKKKPTDNYDELEQIQRQSDEMNSELDFNYSEMDGSFDNEDNDLD